MFEDLFVHKKLVPERLLAYGFVPVGDAYSYTCEILDGDFCLRITLDRHGNPDTALTECDTGEEYVLYKTAAQGAYVGDVRQAIADVLQQIADTCFDGSLFRRAQTLRMTAHAAEVYGSEPEFLWGYTPANAILRRSDSGKWYAAILTVPLSKLGFDTDTPVEIVDLHARPEQVEALLCRPEIYRAWHMNKKSWYTILLDDSVPDAELYALLAESYRLAGKPASKRSTGRRDRP